MRRLKRISLIVLAVLMSITLAVPNAAYFGDTIKNENEASAAAYSDVNNHWAHYYILQANYYGIISGYGNGRFQPDKAVTRAEFATMINNAFGNVLAYDVSYSDVKRTDWYYDAVCKSVNSGITSGYEDGTYRPNRNVTRQEAACMVARLLPPQGVEIPVTSYKDGKKVSDWAVDAFARVIGENVMGPYEDNKLHPNDNLTRAQAAAVLVKVKDKKLDEKDDLVVTKGGITYKNKIYGNSVTVSEKIGNESVTFQNCIFLGPVKINGGGENSIHFKNCRAKYVEVDKSGGTVRVACENETVLGVVEAYGSSIIDTGIESNVLDSGGVGQIVVKKSAATTVIGNCDDVRITGENATVHLSESKVAYLEVPANAAKASITIDKDSSITTANVKSQTDFHGIGKIGKLYAGVKEITYETTPDIVTMGSDVRVSPTKVASTLTMTCNPADKDEGIAFDAKVVVTFNQTIYKNGSLPTLDYVKSKIKFTSKKATGAEVPYTITANADFSVFTLTPEEEFTKKTKYYITIDKEVFTAQDKTIKNKKFQSMFTTGDGTIDGVTFKPAKDSAGAKTNVKPTISFKDSIIWYDGDEIENAADLVTAIVFYKYNEDKKDGKGANVAFTAETDKKAKKITITPKKALDDNSKYVIGFNDNTFRYKATNNPIKGQTIGFIVGNTIPEVTFDPKTDKKIDTTQDFTLKFTEPLLTKDLKKLTSAYVLTALSLTANGNPVEFKVTSIDTDDDTTTIEITNKVAFPEGSKVILKVLPNMLSNKNKKTVEETYAEYDVPLNTPGLSSLSATGVGGSVTASFTSNRTGTAYVMVTSSNNVPTADEVRRSGTSGRIASGTNYITVNSSSIQAGKTYSVYAVGVSGSYVSDVLSTRVTTAYDVAHANDVKVTGLTEIATGNSASVSAGAISDSMTITVDSSLYTATSGVRLEINTDTGTTVLFYDTATGDYETEGISGRISYHNMSPSDFTAGNSVTIRVKAVCTVMEDKIYTVTIQTI